MESLVEIIDSPKGSIGLLITLESLYLYTPPVNLNESDWQKNVFLAKNLKKVFKRPELRTPK